MMFFPHRGSRVKSNDGSVRKTGPDTSRRKKPGQAIVEMALSMPAMLLIMLLTIDGGQVFVDYVQLRNGCREAASYGARNPLKTPEIEAKVLTHAPMLSDGGTTVTVRFSPSGGSYLTVANRTPVQIIVECNRTFHMISTGTLGALWGIGDDIQLDAIATAQVQK